jgi:hypothetical protein
MIPRDMLLSLIARPYDTAADGRLLRDVKSLTPITFKMKSYLGSGTVIQEIR